MSKSLSLWLAHSLFILLLPLLFLSGMQIARSTGYERQLSWMNGFLPTGQVHLIHVICAVIIATALFIYLIRAIYLKRIQHWFNQCFIDSWTQRSSAVFILTSIICLMVSVITGLVSMYDGILSRQDILSLHYCAAWTLAFSVFLHIVTILIKLSPARILNFISPASIVYDVKNNKDRWIIAASIAMTIATTSFILSGNNPSLYIKYSEAAIELDGEDREDIWQNIPELIIATRRGKNTDNQPVNISIKAFHNKQDVYFLFRWPDSTQSLKHLPLIKTSQGWKILQTAFPKADENTFYEDKLAVMFSKSGEIAGAGTVHLGKPNKSHMKSLSSGRGLHYTTDGSITDVWHWKAVRTGLSIGQFDDNYFGPVVPSESEYKRYTRGYQKDDDCEHLVRWEKGDYRLKSECGGYIMNWKERTDGIIQPRRLPVNRSLLRHSDSININSPESDSGRWFLKWQETRRYHPDLDDYPVGTIMPSILSLGAFSQGRGDITSAARWINGYWVIEAKRRLAAPDNKDLSIETGIYMWVAAFNHSQTRHSYHLHPIWVFVK